MAWTFHPIKKFSHYERDWDDLNNRHTATPILQTRFIKPLLEHFSDGNEILAIEEDNGTVNAITILHKTGFGRWETFQPSQSPLGCWIQDKSVDLPILLQSLANALEKPTLLLGVTQLDPNIYPRPKSSNKLHTMDYIETAKITVGNNFEEYWSKRGKNLRQNMNRQRNRLDREGVETKLVTINTPDGIEKGIMSYGKLESAGWKAERGTAIQLDNTQGKFYSAVLKSYCATGDGRIYQYWYDEQLVATDMCISGNGIIVILKTTYDEHQKTSSPALLMRRHYFEPLFDQQEFQHIEFYGKVMTWHTKWSEEIRKLYHINYYAWPALVWLKRLRQLIGT